MWGLFWPSSIWLTPKRLVWVRHCWQGWKLVLSAVNRSFSHSDSFALLQSAMTLKEASWFAHQFSFLHCAIRVGYWLVRTWLSKQCWCFEAGAVQLVQIGLVPHIQQLKRRRQWVSTKFPQSLPAKPDLFSNLWLSAKTFLVQITSRIFVRKDQTAVLLT